MVAIVSGNSLGLSLTSLATLGPEKGGTGNAQISRNGDQAYVNAATGNLVLQNRDDKLVGPGLSVDSVRTYNSLGQATDDNGDNWSLGTFKQQLRLNGTYGSAGSTFVRTDRDGSQAVYALQSNGRYRTVEGEGAYDWIAVDSSTGQWVWTDGSTNVVNIYDAATGRLMSIKDPSGNTLSYDYTEIGTSSGSIWLLKSITTNAGEVTHYDYDGTLLRQIRTEFFDGAATATITRTKYGYDSLNRLNSVTVDLTPDVTTDSNVYITTYGYDGDSTRVNLITQPDGSTTSIEYRLIGNNFRVFRIVDGEGAIKEFNYVLSANSSNPFANLKVVDLRSGLSTAFSYDVAGHLVQVQNRDATGQEILYQYFAYSRRESAVGLVIDGEGRSTNYAYDSSRNSISSTANGVDLRTERAYDAKNQVVRETSFPQGSASPSTSARSIRYAYDPVVAGRLRFVVTAEGWVTEYKYNSFGQRTESFQYLGAPYPMSGMSYLDTLSFAALNSWATSQAADPSTPIQRAEMRYDGRGQLKTVTTHTSLHTGTESSGSTTEYVYDQAGLLLKTISAQGGVTTFAYDGLGRQISSRDAAGIYTLTSYDDISNKTSVRFDNGRIQTSTFDRSGRLISTLEAAGGDLLGEKKFFYDSLGNLRMTTDPTGMRHWILYDAANRKTADIDANGSVVEYRYHPGGPLAKTIRYSTTIDISQLVDVGGAPRLVNIDSIRPTPSPTDLAQWYAYDAYARLVKTVTSAGTVTEYVWNGASQCDKKTVYGVAISTDGFADSLSPAAIVATKTPDIDRSVRYFYDGDNRMRGELDADGYLTEYAYELGKPDGMRTVTTRYANRLDPALSQTKSLAELKVGLSSPGDITSVVEFNGKGQISKEIDAEGYVTNKLYDENGNLKSSERAGRVTTWEYDSLNRVVRETNSENTVTKYVYDTVGNLTSKTVALGEVDARTTAFRFDSLGRVIGELSGEGAAKLGPGLSDAIVEAIWRAHGTTHKYDLAGRRISSEQLGQKTTFFYDEDGNLTYTINGEGEVEERHYNGLGQLDATIRYGKRVSGAYSGGLVKGSGLLEELVALGPQSLNRKASYTYDNAGLIAKITDSTHDVTIKYNAFGQEESRTTGLGVGRVRVDKTTYNRRGLRSSFTTDADSGGLSIKTIETYDPFGRLTDTTDGNGKTRSQNYDRLGRIVETIDARGVKRKTTYDAFNRVLTQVDGNKQTTTYVYNDASRSVTVTSPEGVAVKTVHSRHGQTVTVIDNKQQSTTYEYDHNGHLIKTTSPGDSTIQASSVQKFDGLGNLIETIDARGASVLYEYDKANRLITRTVKLEAGDEKTFYRYDAFGQLITVSVTDPDNVVTKTTYDIEGRVFEQIVDPDVSNLRTAYTHDTEGRTLTVTSPIGVVTTYAYDNLGRRSSEEVSLNGEKLKTLYTYDKNGNVVRKVDANQQASHFAYDDENRLLFSVDPSGAVTRYGYDDDGRLTRTTRYAAAINPAALPEIAKAEEIRLLVEAQAKPGKDAVEGRRYDRDGRLAFTVDGNGAVVKYLYDENGNVREQIAFANAISPMWNGATDPAVTEDPARDVHIRTIYDALNRASFQSDGTGAVTEWRYDRNGNVETRVEYAERIVGDALPNQVKPGDGDRISRFEYDAANRLIWQADATGAVTRTWYDQYGNVAQTRQYAKQITGGKPSSVAPSAGDRVTRFEYDKAGRRTYSVDSMNYVTGWTYYDDGNVKTSTRFATQYFGEGSASLVEKDSEIDRTESYEYDLAGRVKKHTDALGNSESFEYDGVGRKTEYTNKKGAVWKYEYDGLKVIETSPDVPVTTLLGGNGVALAQGATADLAIKTEMLYDALGNLLSRTEGKGLPEEQHAVRTTTYEYDARGHQVKVTFPPVAVYQEGANAGTAPAAALSSQTFYDAFGQAVANVDVAGNISYKAYDAAGHVRYEIDAMGHVTRNEWSPLGDLAEVARSAVTTKFANIVPGSAADAPSIAAIEAELLALHADAAPYRVLAMKYDGLGRVVETKEPEALSLDTPGGTQLARTSKTTTNQYDAFGSLILTEVGGTQTHHYYDRLGREHRTIDALGYVTRREFDEVGNITQVTEYGKQALHYDLYSWGDVEASTEFDRTTNFEYDRLNRKVREERVGVELSTDGNSSARKSLATEFAYDAAGNLISTKNVATGASVFSYYDALGRVTAVASEARRLGAGDDSKTVTPLTLFMRDAYGNVVVKAEMANGDAAQSPFYGNSLFAKHLEEGSLGFTFTADPDRDRYTLTSYDAHGRAVQMVDAGGFTHNTAYDALGRVAKTEQQVLSKDGAPQATKFQIFKYDKLGRLSHTLDPGPLTLDANGNFASASAVTDTELRYNAFGEIEARLVDGEEVETFEYDDAGRMIRTNSGDGVYKAYLYDTLGRRVAEIRSNGETGADVHAAGLAALAANTAGTRRTDTAYDALGRVTQQWLPTRTDTLGGVTARSRATSYTVKETQFATGQANGDSGTTTYTGWGGRNRVELGWSTPLALLGAGEVKVELRYMSAAWPESESGDTVLLLPQAEQTVTRIFTADQADKGVLLDWVPEEGKPGGFQDLLGLKISKKDVRGAWQVIMDQTGVGNAGYTVELKMPDDPNTTTRIEFIDETTKKKVEVASIDFGSAQWFDVSTLPAGNYVYNYFAKAVGQAEQLVSSGRFEMETPKLNSIATPIAFDKDKPGFLSWDKPSSGTVQQFNYRRVGSNDSWLPLTIDTHGAKDGVDVSKRALGEYEFELLWSANVESLPHSHAVGKFTVGGSSTATPLTGVHVENGTVSWDTAVGITGTISGLAAAEISDFVAGTDRLSWTPKAGVASVIVTLENGESTIPEVQVGVDGRAFIKLAPGAGRQQVQIQYESNGQTTAFASLAVDRGTIAQPVLRETASSLDGFTVAATLMQWTPRAGTATALIRRVGTSTWEPLTVTRVGEKDSANFAGKVGTYEYFIRYGTADGPSAVQRGQVTLSGTGGQTQHLPVNTSLAVAFAGGALRWPAGTGDLRVEGRAIGTNVWAPLTATVNDGIASVDLSSLLPGSYDYRVVYADDATASAGIKSFALGSLTIPGGTGVQALDQGRITGFAASGSSLRWDAKPGIARFEYFDTGAQAWKALAVTTKGAEASVSIKGAPASTAFRVSYRKDASDGFHTAFAAGTLSVKDADEVPGATELTGTATFTWRRVGETAWRSAPVLTAPSGRASADISALGTGEFEFRVVYVSPAAEEGGEPIVQAGSNMRVTLYPASTVGLVNAGLPRIETFEVHDAHLQWAGLAGEATLEYRRTGSSTWSTLEVSNDQSKQASADLSALTEGGYEFRIVYADENYALTRGAGELVVNAQGDVALSTPALAFTGMSLAGSKIGWATLAGRALFEIRAAGQSTWSALNITSAGNQSSVDVSALPAGTHEVRVSYRSAAGVLYAVGAANLMIGGALSDKSAGSIISDIKLTPTTMSWDRPAGAGMPGLAEEIGFGSFLPNVSPGGGSQVVTAPVRLLI